MQFFAFLLFVLYAVVVYLYFALIAKILLFGGVTALTLDVCERYFAALGANLFWGPGPADSVRGDEPAYRNYFFDKGWLDYRSIVYATRDFLLADVAHIVEWGVAIMGPFTWFIAVTLWLVLAISAVPATAVLLWMGTIHVAIMAVLSAGAYVSAALLRGFEFADKKFRRISGRCPACHRPIDLPVYAGTCGARHKRLEPGPYGPLYHRCVCGEELPAMLLLGRNKLTSFCPVCSHTLHTAILMVPDLFIPIVGGVSSGKSCVMTASLVEMEKKGSGIKVSFPVANGESVSADQRNYERDRTQYMAGQSMEKTGDGEVRAIQVCLEDAQGHKRLLYAYDAAGEIFRGVHGLGSLPYYNHLHGILFVIDPLPLVSPRVETSPSRPGFQRTQPGSDSAKDVYDKVLRTLNDFSGMRSLREIPLAIVVTKTDALNLRTQILATPVPARTGEKPREQADLRSQAVRAWLLKGEAEPVVRSAEMNFRNIRYFECSALGRTPSQSSRPFEAHGILEPWAWILGQCGLSVSTPPEAHLP